MRPYVKKCFPELEGNLDTLKKSSQYPQTESISEEQNTHTPFNMKYKSKYSEEFINEAVQLANFNNNNVLAADIVNKKHSTSVNEPTIRYWRNLKTEEDALAKSRNKRQIRRRKAKYGYRKNFFFGSMIAGLKGSLLACI
jgi:hypothetical protein